MCILSVDDGKQALAGAWSGKEPCFRDCLEVSEYIKGLLLPHLHTLNMSYAITDVITSTLLRLHSHTNPQPRITVLKHVQPKNTVTFNRLVEDHLLTRSQAGVYMYVFMIAFGSLNISRVTFSTCILTCPRSMQSQMSSRHLTFHSSYSVGVPSFSEMEGYGSGTQEVAYCMFHLPSMFLCGKCTWIATIALYFTALCNPKGFHILADDPKLLQLHNSLQALITSSKILD